MHDAVAQEKKSQTVTRAGSQPSTKGPAEYFTGNVRVDPLFAANESAPYSGGIRHLRAGRAVELAYAPRPASASSSRRRRPHAGMGRTDRRDPRGRPRLVSSRRQALARRLADHRNDAHRADRHARRQERRVDGKGHRRAIRQMTKAAESEDSSALRLRSPPSARGRQAQDVRSVAPALEKYTQERLLGEVWKRPGLSARDRSIVTVAVLVARNQTVEMPYYVNLALDSGVKPAEISELITHLAFYSGWGNAMSAVAVDQGSLCQARHNGQSASIGLAQAPAARRGRRSRSGEASRRAVRRRSAWSRAVHDRRPLPRPLAASGPRAARSKPRHGQRADRLRPGRADALPPQPRDG